HSNLRGSPTSRNLDYFRNYDIVGIQNKKISKGGYMNGDGVVFVDPVLVLIHGFDFDLPHYVPCAPREWDLALVKSAMVLDQRWGIPFIVEYSFFDSKPCGNLLGWFIPFPSTFKRIAVKIKSPAYLRQQGF
ncbi:MAG: hypothetical protein Q7R84_01160, partial [bacterium]|nr:hypothetical protein [bacterium]